MIASIDKNNFTSSFQFRHILFIFFLTITLAGTFSSTVKKSSVRKYTCPDPDFRGRAFNLSPLRILTAGLSSMGLLCGGMNLSKRREMVQHREA